ncbi:aldose epimerase family protein [Pseudomonas matsuisoli]|uniref:Aldose 1-epimerase n=1 Tax=Pseudomonas matsuisoli TaxID=1515666 RepID=A0A917PR83_9PSED|nr:aldose epimerase family protein [Pseudomonas matsuisoli]GGJ88046.1 aldose 1-epimerase [Pseudomonas matsuisoli]
MSRTNSKVRWPHCTLALCTLGCALMMTSFSAAADGLSGQPGTFDRTPQGQEIGQYTLRNSHGMEAVVIAYGATLQALKVPDRQGKIDDIVLGFDDLAGYQANGTVYFGATIGRFGNRLDGGTFTLDGTTYQVPKNDKSNALHGGTQGFDKRIWTIRPHEENGWVGVELTYVSPDGEMGFPGTLTTHVIYSLNDDNELRIQYRATTDKPTVLNLTNHSYFNLAGAGNGTILEQTMRMDASHYTPVKETLIPTGELAPVAGTPMDFRKDTPLGARIRDNHQQLVHAEPKQRGFDFNWVLDTKGDASRVAAEAHDPASGRLLQLYTTEPGVQLYTGNFLDGSIKGKGGKAYPHWGAFTLETQHYPDAPNQSNFPSTRLDPGQTYTQTTVFKLGIR